MNNFRHDVLQRLQIPFRALRNASVPLLVLAALGFVSSPALAQYPRQQTETGQQRANEARADSNEVDPEAVAAAINQACQAAHATFPAPQSFSVTTTPSATPAGIVNVTWSPVPGLDSTDSYIIEYQILGATTFSFVNRLPYNTTSFVFAKAPVFYALRFTISTAKNVVANVPGPMGTRRQQPVICRGQAAYNNQPVMPSTSARLRGFVDLHTHPLTNVAFGGKLMYGGVDGFRDALGNPQGTFLPADPDCQHNVQAGSMEQALGHDRSTHGGPIVRFKDVAHPAYNYNPCGNAGRAQIIHAAQSAIGNYDFHEDSCGLLYPTEDNKVFCGTAPFADWPTWTDVTHQKMWVDWIMRAYAGGLRVMVALATNNKLLGDVVTVGNVSDTSDLPTDDKWSADFQISEIKRFVGNHSDWMQLAYNSADVYNIVASNRLAVVVGVEIDQIGNFKQSAPPSDAQVRAEIDRLYGEGVRYIFPIHLVDNAFGGTAAYEDLFNVANLYEDGSVWHLTCANNPQTDLNVSAQFPDSAIKYQFAGDIGKWGADMAAKLHALGLPTPQGDPSCGSLGQKNGLGLLPAGYTAIGEMMRLGMLIDVDHMSQRGVDDALALASNARYPVMSGHNALRGDMTQFPGHQADKPTERNFRPDQYATIGALHGMAGVGNVRLNAWDWIKRYSQVVQAMCRNISIANCTISAGFGTDTDGLELGSPAPSGHPRVSYYQPTREDYVHGGCIDSTPAGLRGCAREEMTSPPLLPISSYSNAGGQKTWDYNDVGFAHYGLLPDFLQDARNSPSSGAALVDGNVMNGADYFFQTWQIAEATRDRNLGSRPHE